MLPFLKKSNLPDTAGIKNIDASINITSVSVPKYRVKGNFVEYVIECTHNSSTWQVYRRYQQFKALHAQLTSLCPMGTPYHNEYGVIPVLCGSSWTEVTNQSPELVEKRRRYLEIYLQQLLVPKNLFYAAKTAVYAFLHDGEVPVYYKSRTHKPLPGLGTLAVMNDDEEEDDDDNNHRHHHHIGAAGSSSPQGPGACLPLPRKQVVASNTQRLQQPESVLAHSIPDMSAGGGGSKTVGEKIEAAKASREARKPGASQQQQQGGNAASSGGGAAAATATASAASAGGGSPAGEGAGSSRNSPTSAAAAGGGGVAQTSSPSGGTRKSPSQQQQQVSPADASHLPKEKCSNCGATTAITYDLTEWQEYGRCESCNTFTVHLLIPAENDQPELEDDAATDVQPPPCDIGEGDVDEVANDATDEAPPNEGGEVEDVEESHPKADVAYCSGCNQPFSLFLRRHQCYQCNDIFCGYCCAPVVVAAASANTADSAPLPPSSKDSDKSNNSDSKGSSSNNKTLRLCSRCKHNEERQKQEETPETPPTQQASFSAASTTPVSTSSSAIITPQQQQQHPKQPHLVRTDVGPEDFELVTTLGRGTFGKVMKVRFRQTGEAYAMKVLSKPIIHKRRMIDYIKEEKNILSLLRPHPFLVTLHFAFQTDYHLYFVMDFLAGGELYTHIYPHRNLSERDARFYIAEVVLAVEHLHKHDVVHRDIKPENVVLDADGHVKLTDFGLARSNFSKSRRRSFVGSAEYLAPETIQGDVQTRALDWWSIGVMLYEMLHGSAPFTAASNNEVYQSILHKKLDLAKFPASAGNLIGRLLDKDPRHRLIDPEKIKAHAFFSGLDWEALYNRTLPPPFSPDLKSNDTKYFSKDFTSEWATLQKSGGCTRSTLETMIRRFSNFVLVNNNNADADKEQQQQQDANNTSRGAGAASGKDTSSKTKHRSGSPMLSPQQQQQRQQSTHADPTAARLSHSGEGAGGLSSDPNSPEVLSPARLASPSNLVLPQLINPDAFIGVWRLLKVEMVSLDGKVSFPWGSEVAGVLVYCGNGMYTMQLCPMKRHKFKNPTAVTRITKEEMAEAYLGYVAMFGTYEVIPGRSYIVHHPTAALCPNLVTAPQKSFFELKESMLTLATGTVGVEEGITARTAVSWERVV